ncbi:hypothetical protein [Pseudonocardia sp.]|uniref:hypothetical protein n=1 Tax=Pseudonocardia sp. TaxID=60912 RepID=UPI0031FC0E16
MGGDGALASMTRRPGAATLDGADSGPTRWTPSRAPEDRGCGDGPENLAGARWPGRLDDSRTEIEVA